MAISVGLFFIYKHFFQNSPVQTVQNNPSPPQFIQPKVKLVEYLNPPVQTVQNNPPPGLRPIQEIPSEPSKEVTDMRIELTGDAITDLYDQARHFMPWSEVVINNRGPGRIRHAVNHWHDPQTAIQAGENVNIDFGKRFSIKRLFLNSFPGETAIVELQIVI